ncbi:MAG: P-loop NTPase, partial [Treponema sp.]|nr:P-loop NTPase [Treponema sp.]
MEDQAEELRKMMAQSKGSPAKGHAGSSGREKPETRSNSAASAKKARIITVTSGKGGVGKTNLSVNMALAYARLGKKVVVM